MEKKKGFASMTPEERREIAKKGGKAVASIPGHMSNIGRKGGERSGVVRKKNPDQTPQP